MPTTFLCCLLQNQLGSTADVFVWLLEARRNHTVDRKSARRKASRKDKKMMRKLTRGTSGRSFADWQCASSSRTAESLNRSFALGKMKRAGGGWIKEEQHLRRRGRAMLIRKERPSSTKRWLPVAESQVGANLAKRKRPVGTSQDRIVDIWKWKQAEQTLKRGASSLHTQQGLRTQSRLTSDRQASSGSTSDQRAWGMEPGTWHWANEHAKRTRPKRSEPGDPCPLPRRSDSNR
ncbi:hypothetical protein MAC_06672 [Metarhizium acridum CQMa 102]|uniref:Uncharacterized protein n=1 Tax=Metarhizium acridum (strain CQMa 102) TaxID=655827 RepID=E9E9X4_METAQ|nr:uncharacterized protein MAC_06672 [Metarhizium acridum CQMa 102]EFY87325.1 hypothetical protein MAC_06672 [Metarhizium acridum CQMa 102]